MECATFLAPIFAIAHFPEGAIVAIVKEWNLTAYILERDFR